MTRLLSFFTYPASFFTHRAFTYPAGFILPLIPPLTCILFISLTSAEALSSYILYIFLCFLWWLFLQYVFRLPLHIHPLGSLEGVEARSALVVLIPLLLCFAVSLALYRKTTDSSEFLCTLGVLLLQGVAFRILQSRILSFRLPLLYLTFALLTGLGFYTLLDTVPIESMPLIIGAAALPFITWLGSQMFHWPASSKEQDHKIRLYTSRLFCLFAGLYPASLLVAATAQLVPRYYLLAAMPLFLMPPLIQHTREFEAGSPLPQRFLVLTRLLPVMYLTLLLAVRVYYAAGVENSSNHM